MKAKLLIHSSKKEDIDIALSKQQETTLGRSRKCTIHLNDVRLSRVHCTIFYREPYFYVQDNNSTNGCYVNESKISSAKKLKHGTNIRIGGSQIIYMENNQKLKTSQLIKMDLLDVIGPYKIKEKLGKGGIGTVYKAEHKETKEIVAIKILKPEVSEDEKMLARFIKEARVTAILNHPTIVKTLDMGIYLSDPYIVLEYIPYPPLSEVVYDAQKLSISSTLLIAEQIANALICSHKEGIIHRDIKPSNILVSKKRRAKLIDMGLVKVIHESGLTLSGQAMGTPRYMSPEQIVDSKSVDARTDLYALGATMYYCISGRPPYYSISDKRVANLLKKIYDSAPEPINSLVEIPRIVEDLINKSMERRPSDRFRNAKSFYKAIIKVRKKLGYDKE